MQQCLEICGEKSFMSLSQQYNRMAVIPNTQIFVRRQNLLFVIFDLFVEIRNHSGKNSKTKFHCKPLVRCSINNGPFPFYVKFTTA